MTILYFMNTCARLRCSALEFFETAYMAIFGKWGDVTPDYCVFLQHGILPIYVVNYLKRLQVGETSC